MWKMAKILHWRSQANQPYGSVSRKCCMCGIMIWPRLHNDKHPEPEWTGSEDTYKDPPDGYIKCVDVPIEKRHNRTYQK